MNTFFVLAQCSPAGTGRRSWFRHFLL